MPRTLLSLALSLSVLALAATPGFAQIRRSGSAAPAAATAPANGAVRPGATLRVFIGPAGDLGNQALTVTRSQSTTNTSATTGTDAVNTSGATTSISTTNMGMGLGLMYGADYVWWGGNRAGVGLSLFGSYTGAGTSTNILHLNGQDVSVYKNSTTVSGTTTTTATMTDTTAITSALPGGPNYTVAIGIPAAGVTNPVTTTYSQVGGATLLTLRQGDDAATNPKSNFVSQGGMGFASSRSMWINDLSFHGDYVLAESPTSGISLFGGMTLPVGSIRQGTSAKTVGDKGNGDTAKQTETGFAADGSTAFVRVTDTTLNNSITADSSMLLAGPVIGLNAYYGLNNGMLLYTQVGYAPVLAGTMTTSINATSRNKSVVTISQATPASGLSNGTTTTESNVTVPSTIVTNVTGSETFGSVGFGFGAAGFNLFTEATARGYGLGGMSSTVVGAKLGGTFTF